MGGCSMKRGSLVYQINQRFFELERFGQSKHKAKEIYRKEHPGKTPRVDGIYSYKTMTAYRQTLKEFTPFIKNKGIKNIEDVTKEHIKEYLQSRQERGLSPYTLSKDLAAFNKFFNFELTKKALGLNSRSYKDITQSRAPTKEGQKYNPQNWQRQIAIVRNFGVRRESVCGGSYQLREGSLYKTANGDIYVSVVEKGGRFRNVKCLKKGVKEIERLFPDMPTLEKPFEEREFKEKYRDLGDHLFT
jgi:site-specific recombinase XerC